MAKEGKKKIRVSFRKNQQTTRREGDLTRRFRDQEQEVDQAANSERVRARGDASRNRTVMVEGDSEQLALTDAGCLRGRVLMAQGLQCVVVTDDGRLIRCYIRRLLKSLESEERSVVVTGDWVWFKPAPGDEGMVVRVEPRLGLLTREYRHREHVIAANVNQVLIINALADPEIKPSLIDRYLVSAGKGRIEPVICINKADLGDASQVEFLIGLYNQLGYRALLTSARTGLGIDALRQFLTGRETVVVGQSGVGKSSLLNALQPAFHLKVSEISSSTHKGKHTTTSSQLLRLEGGGTVVDTPGIRQFDPWAVTSGEVEGYFIEFRPFAPHCRFSGCTHLHEDGCAVLDAVATRLISASRYDSYVRIYQGDSAD